jgi:hypothetical protein
MGWLAQVPGTLLYGAIAAMTMAAVLTMLLGWHALRRLLGIPRVPRPRAMYVVLGGFWIALVAACSAAVATIAMLRDYRPVDRATALAEVRCAPVGLDRAEAELRAAPAAPPERYQVEGDACIVWVNQVELRPGLGRFGVRALSRVEGVGPIARPGANPDWLTPRPQGPRGLVNLLVRRTETVPVAVPLDASARLTIVSSPSGPTVRQSAI